MADAFPLAEAFEKCRDSRGRSPTEPDYDDRDWEQVTLPHTFNGSDLFSVPIEDGGSGQKRTCAFYRNRLEIPAGQAGKRVILAFEGVRQTCYAYVNGRLAGYYEAGGNPERAGRGSRILSAEPGRAGAPGPGGGRVSVELQ